METFSALLAICAGNSPGTGEFPAQRPVTWSFDVILFFICVSINGWVNNHEAGDLRHCCAHYNIIVMHCRAVKNAASHYSEIRWTPLCPTTWLTQLFIQQLFSTLKETLKLHITGLLPGQSMKDLWISHTKASNAESVSMSWHYPNIHRGSMLVSML